MMKLMKRGKEGRKSIEAEKDEKRVSGMSGENITRAE